MGLPASGRNIEEETTIPELTVSADGLHWRPGCAEVRPRLDLLLPAGPVTFVGGKQQVAERFCLPARPAA